jgi:hypothetical protein
MAQYSNRSASFDNMECALAIGSPGLPSTSIKTLELTISPELLVRCSSMDYLANGKREG